MRVYKPFALTQSERFSGLMNWAFQYDEDTVGLCSLEDYPYAYREFFSCVGHNGLPVCIVLTNYLTSYVDRHWFWGCSRYAPYCTPVPDTRVSKYVNITETEEDLKAAIAIQPVSGRRNFLQHLSNDTKTQSPFLFFLFNAASVRAH